MMKTLLFTIATFSSYNLFSMHLLQQTAFMARQKRNSKINTSISINCRKKTFKNIKKYNSNTQQDKELTEILISNAIILDITLNPFSEQRTYTLLHKQKKLINTYNSNPAKSKYIIMKIETSRGGECFPEIKIYNRD